MTQPPRRPPLPASAAPSMLKAMDLMDQFLAVEPGVLDPTMIGLMLELQNSSSLAADVALALAAFCARALADPDTTTDEPSDPAVRKLAQERWEKLKMYFLQAASRDITPDDQIQY